MEAVREDSGPAGGTPAVLRICGQEGYILWRLSGRTAVQPVGNQRSRG